MRKQNKNVRKQNVDVLSRSFASVDDETYGNVTETNNIGFQKSLEKFRQMEATSTPNPKSVEQMGAQLGGSNKTKPQQQYTDKLFDIHQLEREKMIKDYQHRLDFKKPIEQSKLSYPQIDFIPISVDMDETRVWDFCVAYAATALYRRATGGDMIVFDSNPGMVGTWWFAAVALFNSLYECSLGGIPPLQRVSQELADIFLAISPKNRGNKSYVVRWPGIANIHTFLQGLPYNSFTQPEITLAPWTGALDAVGRLVISNTIPAFTMEDVQITGTQAFEYAQRYLLQDEIPLVSYTNQGRYGNNVAIFSCPTTSGGNPVDGFVQMINECRIKQEDYFLLQLGFSVGNNERQAFNCKTVQLGTHMAMLRIITGGKVSNQTLLHQMDFGVLSGEDISIMIAAEFESLESETLKTIDVTPTFPSQYVDQATAGQLLSTQLCEGSRRFGFLSAMSAGNVLPDGNSRIIGAGTKFITGGSMDNAVGWLELIEDLAANSSFDASGVFHLPVLTTRGLHLTVDYYTPGSESLLWFLHHLYPTTQDLVLNYDMAAPGGTDLPNSIDLALDVCFTEGASVQEAVEIISSIRSLLQASSNVGVATASADGPRCMMLYLSHYIIPPLLPPFWNLSFSYPVDRLMSTASCDPRTGSKVLTRLAPVIYGRHEDIAAYQTLYGRSHSVEVGATYMNYRGPTFVANAHRRAANMFPSSEQAMGYAHDTVVEVGGNFVDYFLRDGKWISALELLGEGLGSFISDDAAKMGKSFAGKAGHWIHETFFSNKRHKSRISAAAPIFHGLMSIHDYQGILREHNLARKSLVVYSKKASVPESAKKGRIRRLRK